MEPTLALAADVGRSGFDLGTRISMGLVVIQRFGDRFIILDRYLEDARQDIAAKEKLLAAANQSLRTKDTDFANVRRERGLLKAEVKKIRGWRTGEIQLIRTRMEQKMQNEAERDRLEVQALLDAD